jgi:hypothetical protein
MNIAVRKATKSDAEFIGAHLREADIVELLAAGSAPATCVPESFAMSRMCRVATVDDIPAIIWGVCDAVDEPGVGVPWMLATDGIMQISRDFIRGCAAQMDDMRRGYHLLANAVHSDNRIALRWLRWLGFDVSCETDERGFLPFFMECVHV